MTATQTVLAELSRLLGVQVVRVLRDAPAHERPEVTVVAGAWVRRPAQERLGAGVERVARRWWHLHVVDPEAAGQVLYLRLLSEQVRDGRRLTEVLHDCGRTGPALDNRAARRVLALMHQHIEDREKEKERWACT